MNASNELYRALGTVLENAEHGPQLCGVIAMSYPPLGGGYDIEGWSWESVAHEEASGVRWGNFVLTGHFDGETFTLTQPPEQAERDSQQRYPELGETGPGEPIRAVRG
ncbi:hypothetical protein [Natronoglycomyces albus]|uniref:Uncharacterized protein n=1 Tax=Natronoglycomyces albus TaxID=2811108 RepID=A0A895XQP5_9ACTN|nr:hypothetical protein [Natronoglycomyces albus]QSB05475.1 hypothetical protein JQS30_00580 [Natronoglycomyces albus]